MGSGVVGCEGVLGVCGVTGLSVAGEPVLGGLPCMPGLMAALN